GGAGDPRRVPDLAAAVREREAAARGRGPAAAPRWLWSSTAAVYPPLLSAGVRVGRCHDLELTEALLLAYAGRWGEPRSVAAVLARRAGAPVPPDPPPVAVRPPGDPQQRLFDVTPEVSGRTVTDLVTAYADQCDRIAATSAPERFR